MALKFIPKRAVYPAGLRLARNAQPGHSVVHKFGRNSAIGTSFAPICAGGIYRTPQTATALRVKAGNAADTADGAGAREIELQGLNELGELVTEKIATAGASASASTTTTFIRLFRAKVTASGTYASQSAASHVGDIVIEDATGSEDWATIESADFPRGQSQIGAFSIPLGYEGYIQSIEYSSESSKLIDLNFYAREDILASAPPYSAKRLQREFVGLEGNGMSVYDMPKGPYPALTDIGFMAKVAVGTADVSIDFTIILVGT